jgi:NADH dehydrogenase
MSKIDYANIPESRSPQDAGLHRVLIVGGGAGGLELATQLGDSLGKRAKAAITLLDKSRVHVWKPHLHEVASGTLDVHVDSLEYLAHARAHHYRNRMGEMAISTERNGMCMSRQCFDDEEKQLLPPRALGYDTLVLAVGSVGNDFGTHLTQALIIRRLKRAASSTLSIATACSLTPLLTRNMSRCGRVSCMSRSLAAAPAASN